MPGLTRASKMGKALKLFPVSLPALGVGIVCCMVLALLAGVSPFALFDAIREGAWGGKDAAAATASKITPLLLNGLGVAMAYQADLLNIGCEGQMRLGALAAATFAIFAGGLPWGVLLPLTVLVGALVGALWAFPAVWLKQRRGIHEVISTLLMNYVAIYLADYLVLGPLGDGTVVGRTVEIPSGAIWPVFWHFGRTGITAAPVVALLLCFLAGIWLMRTSWGFEARAAGSGAAAARAAGVPVDRWQRRMFILSGAMAGLAGALETVAVHHRFYRAFSPGYGFDGITAAFLVNADPGWLWLSSLLLASLRSADKWLQLSLGISPAVVLVIQAVLLLAAACRPDFRFLFARAFFKNALPEDGKENGENVAKARLATLPPDREGGSP